METSSSIPTNRTIRGPEFSGKHWNLDPNAHLFHIMRIFFLEASEMLVYLGTRVTMLGYQEIQRAVVLRISRPRLTERATQGDAQADDWNWLHCRDDSR